MKLKIRNVKWQYCYDSNYCKEFNYENGYNDQQADEKLEDLMRLDELEIEFNEERDREIINELLNQNDDVIQEILVETIHNEDGEYVYGFDLDDAIRQIQGYIVMQEMSAKGIEINHEYVVIIDELLQNHPVIKVIAELNYVFGKKYDLINGLDIDYLVFDIAFDKGIEDYEEGIEVSENPYTQDYLREAWESGWENG